MKIATPSRAAIPWAPRRVRMCPEAHWAKARAPPLMVMNAVMTPSMNRNRMISAL